MKFIYVGQKLILKLISCYFSNIQDSVA